MNIQPTPAPESLLPVAGTAAPLDPMARVAAEQKAAAKARKKARKRERLRFFAAWCEGWQAFSSAF